MGKYKALDIARWFIYRNIQVEEQGGEKLTLLKLLKLLYYAEGSSLALDNGSLFDEPIVAWENGPVVEDVYKYYSKDPYDLGDISELDLSSINKIKEDDIAILEEVFQIFGSYSAWALRNKTHQEKPWLETTKKGSKLNDIIDRKLLESYFRETYVE